MDFMDAVKDLAGQAGREMPARSPEEAERARAVESVHDVLHRAADWYAAELATTPVALAILLRRGVSVASVEKFGLVIGRAWWRGRVRQIGCISGGAESL